jgi:hypothetical protein
LSEDAATAEHPLAGQSRPAETICVDSAQHLSVHLGAPPVVASDGFTTNVVASPAPNARASSTIAMSFFTIDLPRFANQLHQTGTKQ